MTLNSELFVQSDRLAALAVTGGQRYLLFSVVGVTFPFLIVSTSITHHKRLSAMLRCLNCNRRSCSRSIFVFSLCPRKPWTRTAFCCSPVSARLAVFIPSSSCRRPKGKPWCRSPMSLKQSPSVANPQKRVEPRPNSERLIVQKKNGVAGGGRAPLQPLLGKKHWINVATRKRKRNLNSNDQVQGNPGGNCKTRRLVLLVIKTTFMTGSQCKTFLLHQRTKRLSKK